MLFFIIDSNLWFVMEREKEYFQNRLEKAKVRIKLSFRKL